MINKNIVAMGFVSFFTDMASSMVTSILPLFIVYILYEGVDKLGLIVAFSTFISYGFRFVFGYLSDKTQVVKPFVVSGYIISAVTKPMLYFSSSWGSIAMLRGVERVGKAVRSATKDTLISAYSGGKSGKTFGFHKSMDIAGEVFGSLIVFVALCYFGQSRVVFETIFAFTLLPGLLSVFIVWFYVKDVPYRQKSDYKFDLSKDYHLLPTLFIFFGFIFFMFNDSYYLIKAKEAGYALEYIPLLVVVLNLTQTLFSYMFGLQIDKIGAKKVLFFSFGFGFCSLLSLYFGFIIVGFIFLGLFTVSSLNAIRAYISKHAHNKSTIFGIFYGGVAISGALGASFTGIIWHYYGQNVAFYFSLFGILLVFVIGKLKIKRV